MRTPYQQVFTDPRIEAQLLMSMGYRRVSLKHGSLARLDDDWAMRAAQFNMPHLRGKNREKYAQSLIDSRGKHSEYYLRCQARDNITVHTDISQRVESATSYGPEDATPKEPARKKFILAHQGQEMTEYGRAVLASLLVESAKTPDAKAATSPKP